MKTNLKAISKRLDKLAACILQEKEKVEVEALEAGKSLMIKRIFGVGANGGGRTLDGDLFGEYTDAYRQKRIRKGLTNLNKNLFFTGALQHSIQVGTNSGKNVLGFTDLELEKIARFQEESELQINEPIFQLNDEELSIALETVMNGVENSIQRCFNQA